MNLDKYKGLPAKAREFLDRQALAYEQQNDFWKTYNQNETKRQAEAGIQTITFDAATSKAYVEKAKEIGWATAIKASPQYGAAAEEGAGEVGDATRVDRAPYGRLLEALRARRLRAGLRHDADDLRRRAAAQRALVPAMRGLAWANEISEAMLYLITMLTAPWLLRRGPAHPRRHRAARHAAGASAGTASGSSTCSPSPAALVIAWLRRARRARRASGRAR